MTTRIGIAGRRAWSAAVAALLLGAASGAATAQAAQAPRSAAARPTAYPGGIWEPGPARYGATVVNDVPVTMDDGVVLRASIAYPVDPATGKRAAGRFPVIVEHTPYVRLGQPVHPLTFFTERGYIVALVRARGTGNSGGEVQNLSPREGEDGKAIVDWAARRLDGSDGRLALIGCSYPAGVALTDAAHVGPNSPVKAVVAACNGFHSQNRGTFMRNGMMTSNFRTVERIVPYLGNTPSAAATNRRLVESVRAGGDLAYDREHYRARLQSSLARRIVANGIPVLLWSGWQDRVEGAVRSYTAFQNAWAGRPLDGPMAPNQPTTPRYQLLMGDWGHADGLDLGLYLQWIETWLKGIDTGIQRTPTPMHLFEVGSNRWVNLARYPATTEHSRWYLGSGGTLSLRPPSGGGSERLVRQEPDLPGGRLTFMTPPLARGATLAGPISATIYASSSNTNLQMIARLFDIAPDGQATEISMGAMLGSLRELDPAKSWTDRRGTVIWPWPKLERDSYLTPGRVYRFDLSLLSRQWGIAPGHRLRLTITGQSTAADCSPNPPPESARTRATHPCDLTAVQEKTVPGGSYTIMRTPAWPSALNLPQLPWKIFPEVRSGPMPYAYSENQRRLEPDQLTIPLDWGGGGRAAGGP